MAPPPLPADGSPPSPSSATSTSPNRRQNYNHHHHPEVHSVHPIISPINLSDNFIHAFSGATAGFASGVVTCPLDVIKTKLQAQGGFIRHARQHPERLSPTRLMYRGFTGTARMIWKDEGIRGMYRGLAPIILGYLPTWAVYFTVYEGCKDWLGHTEIKQQWVTHILSAMIAGGSSTICTNPIWVIKTRLMSQASQSAFNTPGSAKAPWHYTSTVDAIRKMYLHEGIGAFYSGLGPALLGLTHVAVQFPLYEQFKKLLERKKAPGDTEQSVDFIGILAASCLSKVCASSATYPHEVLRTRLQTQYRPNNGHVGKFVGTGGAFVSVDGSAPLGRPAASPVVAAPPPQTTSVPRYSGIISSAKTIYREEGWRAFYAGMGTNMIRAVPASAMTLLTYEFCSSYLLKRKQKEIESLRLEMESSSHGD
ncbi:mitochondrial carrier protein [Peziza echinospora]|nr:mitochondrial carrier protein [Peziza echinospora]